MIKLEIHCPLCGGVHYVTVGQPDFDAWQNGELAQVAFPYLSPTEREQLISKLCPMCQDEIFN